MAPEIMKGLKDVYLDTTESSFIDGEEGKLLYRGYNIHDLAEKSTFEHLIEVSRAEAYESDIVYGTNNEFGFDYLRDNMATSAEERSQGLLSFAIVDEADSILIDEARTP